MNKSKNKSVDNNADLFKLINDLTKRVEELESFAEYEKRGCLCSANEVKTIGALFEESKKEKR